MQNTLPNSFIKTVTGLAMASLILLASPLGAQEQSFVEGGHYQVLASPQPVSTGDKIEVLELFWYRCPHCNTLEAPIHNWLQNGKPENAEYVPMPAILGPNWETGARQFYTLEALGLLDEYHPKLFYAIHAERKNLESADRFADWVAENGGNKEDVLDTWESFAVNTKTNFAKTLSVRYQLEGVPAFVIDGRYQTSVSQAGSTGTLFEVINFLVEKAAAERS